MRHRRSLTILAACWVLLGSGSSRGDVSSLQTRLPPDAGPCIRNIAKVLNDQIRRRCEAAGAAAKRSPCVVELAVAPGIGDEEYKISDGPDGAIRIAGNDTLGLLYGVGKFLRTSRYDQGGFTPSRWRGESKPECPFRAIYAATHFMNFYEAAPAEEVRRYIAELGLWGANTLIVHCPVWTFDGFDDPEAQRNLKRLRCVLQAGKDLGMNVGLVQTANQTFKTCPRSLLAAKYPDDLGRRGGLGVNCCPSRPDGRDCLMKMFGRLFEEFKGIGLDVLVFWPYDEGGCGCTECWPWGAKGYPRLSRDVTFLARKAFPGIKTALSTWVYDTPPAGEWAGLAKFLETDKTWLDYVMADAHENFPRYPLDNGAPGGLPLVNFPEISMWGRNPWGGYGANPLPDRLERLWKQTEGKLAGGMPYSEGIFEDINNVICLQFYWDKNRSARETLKEYIASEYSPEVVGDLLDAARLLEETWLHVGPKSLEAGALVAQAEARLTPQAKAAWRWRILKLRTVIDGETFRRGGKREGPVLKEAFDELTRFYHAECAHPYVRPPAVN